MRIRGSIAGVTPGANPLDDPEDLDALARYSDDLLAAVQVALPGWVQRVVATRWEQWHGGEPPPELVDAAMDAAAQASEAVVPALRELLATDVAEQATNPLSIVRGAVVFPTRVLASTGMPGVVRDEHAERLFPEDVYDLVPGSFGDVDPSVHEPGLRWGAAKAHVLLRRRRED
jgi:hypothetical protein